jgi:hypothetical protein
MTKRQFDRKIAESTARAERRAAYREAESRWAAHVGGMKTWQADLLRMTAAAAERNAILDASDARLAEEAERRVNAHRAMVEHARRPPNIAEPDSIGMLPRNRHWDK